MRDVAENEPELIKKLAAVFADLGKAVEDRPREVKAAIAKLFPDLDGATIDLLFESESLAWKSPPITAQEIAHEIAYVKSTGRAPPEIDGIDPASMLLKPN
jgi:ABC-type nitrate/sulfonate/bicarbonate transport system substrate-binding protein